MKKTLIALIALAIACSLNAGTYGGGSGTPGDQYIIATYTHLLELQNTPGDWDAYFKQTDDIIASGTWSPIGNTTTEFTGYYNGQGYSIRDLYITDSGEDYLALFGYTYGATIKDICLVDCEIIGQTAEGIIYYITSLVAYQEGGSVSNCYANGSISIYYTNDDGGAVYVAGLIAYQEGGSVNDCYSECTVQGDCYTGGLIAYQEGGSVSNCYATGSVLGYYDYTGGLIGCQEGSTVTDCYATGTVLGDGLAGDYWFAGGLIGRSQSGCVITDCYATGTVTGCRSVGGLIGEHDYSTVADCYATGSVTATYSDCGGLSGCRVGGPVTNCYATGSVIGDYASGGLIGLSKGDDPVTNCYATGSVTGTERVGGLVGHQVNGTVTNCYARSSVSGAVSVGGFFGRQVGSSGGNASAINCYATGLVSGSSSVGGFVGEKLEEFGGVCTVTSCYWDTETSGQSTSSGGTGKTTAEMHTQSTYIDWDFTDTWSIEAAYNDSYPYLQDNSPFVGIIGDFNGDGYVDVLDSQLFGDHWLFEEGDTGWDALYDLVVDGIIDLLDSQVFGDHWHEGTSPTLLKGNEGKGPNADAGIVFDLDPAYGNQNLTHLDSQAAGTYIKVGVYCTNVHNLDTYAFDVVYNSNELTYITATAMSSAYEPNILTTESGTAVNWMLSTSSGRACISYTLTGQDTTQAPEGEGLLGEIIFQAKVPTYATLQFEDVKYSDTFCQLDDITDTGTATLPVEGNDGYIEDFKSNSLSNFPNPVKGSTTISYAVKGMIQSQPVEIDIYNMLGQLVDTIEGKNGTATWNTSGHASGVYFYRLNTDSYTEIKKMMLIR